MGYERGAVEISTVDGYWIGMGQESVKFLLSLSAAVTVSSYSDIYGRAWQYSTIIESQISTLLPNHDLFLHCLIGLANYSRAIY